MFLTYVVLTVMESFDNALDALDSYNREPESRYEMWEGREGMRENGTVGMLLDLIKGTLEVHKNGRRLGVMKTGLSGEYCWFSSMFSPGEAVSIKREKHSFRLP